MIKILKKKENREMPVADFTQPMEHEVKKSGETDENMPEEITDIQSKEKRETIFGTEEKPSAEEESETPRETSAGFSIETLTGIKEYAAKESIPDETKEKVIEIIREIGESWENGGLTLDHFMEILKCVEYDDKIVKAFADGELKGRNEQIEEKYMHPEESDGLPHPFGGGSIAGNRREITTIFDLARNAG